MAGADGLILLAWLLVGYLAGSIPFGLLLTRAAGLGDVRKLGSGNIGATNVLRTGSKRIAALTLLLDALKGAVPVLLASAWSGEPGGLSAGLGAFLGHLFPVWIGFKGGKGVATYIGVLFGLWWPLGLAFLAIWLTTAILTRISSLSALVSSILVPLGALALGRVGLASGLAVLSAAIFFTHRENIRRLMRGDEPKINLARKA